MEDINQRSSKAFELGFNDIEVICQVKRDRGKIELFLP